MTVDRDKQVLTRFPAPQLPSMTTVGLYISNYIFEIPDNQRGYSWTKTHWQALWYDIMDISDGKNHYIATSIVTGTPYQMQSIPIPHNRGILSLIDGQQRMTTIMLLLRAILHHIDEVQSTHILNQRIKSLLVFQGRNTNDQRTILINRNSVFQQCFQSIILTGTFATPQSRAENNMLEAFTYYKNLIEGRIANLSNPEQINYLIDLTDRVQNRLVMSLVDLTEDLEPALVFESINNRGLTLSNLDRVKNMLMLIESRMNQRSEFYLQKGNTSAIVYGCSPPINNNLEIERIFNQGNPCFSAKQSLDKLEKSINDGENVNVVQSHLQELNDAHLAVQKGINFDSIWFKTISKLDEYGLSSITDEDRMLANYWCMLTAGGYPTDSSIYNPINKEFWILTKEESPEKEILVRNFANGILDCCEAYCEFFVTADNPKFGTFEKFNTTILVSEREAIKTHLKDFRAVGYDTMMSSFSIATYLKVNSKDEYIRYLKNLEKCIFRVYRIADKRQNDYLPSHGNEAKRLYNDEIGGLTSGQYAMNYLCTFTIQHCSLTKMKNILLNQRDMYGWQKSSVAKYFLYMYERAIMPAAAPALSYGEYNIKVNIEHILPQSPSTHYWTNKNGRPEPRFTDQELDEDYPECLIHNLGNLVLSQHDFNSAYGNAGYNVKRIRYLRNNDLLRVKEIANNYQEWRNIFVKYRQRKMIDFAVIDDGSGNGRWKLDCDADIPPESSLNSENDRIISETLIVEDEDFVRHEDLSEITWTPPVEHLLHNFAPAVDNMDCLVYGSNRPGYKIEDNKQVPLEITKGWINFMQGNEITRVICLLNNEQKIFYENKEGQSLIELYKENFLEVINPEVTDYKPPTEDQIFNEIIPFLEAGEEKGEKTLIHCSMGKGRTGFVLHAWNCYKGDTKSDDRNYLLGTRDPWESGALEVCNKIFKKCEELSNEEE